MLHLFNKSDGFTNLLLTIGIKQLRGSRSPLLAFDAKVPARIPLRRSGDPPGKYEHIFVRMAVTNITSRRDAGFMEIMRVIKLVFLMVRIFNSQEFSLALNGAGSRRASSSLFGLKMGSRHSAFHMRTVSPRMSAGPSLEAQPVLSVPQLHSQ